MLEAGGGSSFRSVCFVDSLNISHACVRARARACVCVWSFLLSVATAYKASDVELHKMIQAMGELLGRDHGHSEDSDLTRMHEVHSDIEREKLCHKLPAAIEADPDCHKWQSNGANSDANRILQYMRQCNVSSVQPFMRGKWYEKVDFQDNNGWEKCSQLGPITEELQPVVPRVKVAPAHLSDLVDSVLREEGKEVMVVANMQQP